MSLTLYMLDRLSFDETTRCWNWKGVRDKDGYGQLKCAAARDERAHRVAAYLWLGIPLDSPLKVLHRCDNPPCFNPKHLFGGTVGDNQRDMCAKGRHKNQIKTHCPQGHPYSEENTYYHKTPKTTMRHCKICRKKQFDDWRARVKQERQLEKQGPR